jgi:hypothetical protein
MPAWVCVERDSGAVHFRRVPRGLRKRDGEGNIRSYMQGSFRTCFHLAGEGVWCGATRGSIPEPIPCVKREVVPAVENKGLKTASGPFSCRSECLKGIPSSIGEQNHPPTCSSHRGSPPSGDACLA